MQLNTLDLPKQTENKKKELIYFPSLSAGPYLGVLKKNYTYSNGLCANFLSKNFHPDYRHPYFLVTAGHFYKKQNFRKDLIPEQDVVVMGDSGGYQIASGAIKWDSSLKEKIFHWLEDNSNVAMNLDIPPRMEYEGRYEECMQMSLDNFKYFNEHQTGKTDFLNIIQGATVEEYWAWYNKVNHFEFQGWAIGGALDLYRIMGGISVLLRGKEHLNKKNKWIHILGKTGIPDLLIFAQLQKSLNEIGANINVCTDSSTPSLNAVYGQYIYNYNLKTGAVNYLHCPKKDEKFNINLELPYVTGFNEYLKECFTYKDMYENSNLSQISLILHNTMVYTHIFKTIKSIVNGPTYILEQIITKDMMKILQSIDEMVKDENPQHVFDKYSMLYHKISSELNPKETAISEFFEFV